MRSESPPFPFRTVVMGMNIINLNIEKLFSKYYVVIAVEIKLPLPTVRTKFSLPISIEDALFVYDIVRLGLFVAVKWPSPYSMVCEVESY